MAFTLLDPDSDVDGTVRGKDAQVQGRFRGEITVSALSRIAITIPRPPNSPEVDSFISSYTSGGSSTECGSNVESRPPIAAYSSSSGSFCGGSSFFRNAKTS